MSCCGKARQTAGSPSSQPNHAPGVQPVQFRKTYGSAAAGVVTFEYQGGSTLTVTGQGTGMQYRFAGHGSRASVDSRDRASLLVVPGLREVNR